MRLTIRTTDGGSVEIRDADADLVLGVTTALADPAPDDLDTLRIELDNGASFVEIVRAHVVRVDVDPPLTALQRLARRLHLTRP